MKKDIQQNLPLLKYVPFWAFEWVLLFLSAVYFIKLSYTTNNLTLHYGVFFGIWSLSAIISRFYAYERNLTITKQLQRFILFSVFFAVFFYAVTLLSLQEVTWIPQVLVKSLITAFLLKAVAILTIFSLRKQTTAYQQNILVYNSGTGKNFIRDVRQLKRTGFQIYEAEKTLFRKESLERFKEKIMNDNIQIIYIPLEVAFKEAFAHILNLNWNKQVSLKLITDYNAPITGRKAQFYGLTQVTKYYISPLDSTTLRMLKRVFDVIFSGLVILTLLSWFVPLMALLIRLDSKGPTFFVQKRPGRFNKPFLCFKFRSMTVNNKTEKSAVRDDVRVTRIGKFIRKTSIDELPQFFNVLLGHMSIVGPRPNLSSQLDYYSPIINDYPKRMYLKPGITGLAQVSGARGGIEEDIEMKHRVKYDVFYIRNWSFTLDIKIIIRTAVNMIRGEDKAY